MDKKSLKRNPLYLRLFCNLISIGIVQKGYVFDGNLEFFNSLLGSTLMLQNKPGAISAGRPARSNIHVNDFLRIHHFRRGPAA